jgi:hypothetical protein
MKPIRTYAMANSSILRINAEKDRIDVDPEYQRNSGIWTIEKRQLLVDSILNEYDIPKLYLHDLSVSSKAKPSKYKYAVIDGRQRLETIWGFIRGEFPLSDDFEYFEDKEVEAGNMTYSEMSQTYPDLKIRFDGFILPIVLIETSEIEMIEEMFLRLNEAVPLNAAEKRNAIGGPMAIQIRELTKHIFFKKYVKFFDKRFQHQEVAARLLFLEDCETRQGKIIDTKKPYLDGMVEEYKNKKLDAKKVTGKVKSILDSMVSIFNEKDSLLRSQSAIPIYYLLTKHAIANATFAKINRNSLLKFHEDVDKNHKVAEKDITKANFDLLEYERMSQQGTNDASSIRERIRIIKDYLQI